MGNPAQDLIAVLNEQIRCAQTMLGALSRENRALLDGDADGLNAAGADKARLVETLEALETERRTLSATIGHSFAAQAGAHEPTDAEWRTLLALVAECKQQNQRNGALVKARGDQVRTALKLVRGAEAELYDGAGSTAARGSARALGQA